MPPLSPTISVVIPAYNYGRFLPKAVLSVLDQDFHDLEVVVVDDCSTDDTPERLRPLLADSRLRYLRNERNLGAVPNINKAFTEAHGEMVMLLGADDFLLPGSLSRLHQALRRYPEAGFAYGNYVIADEDDRITATIRHPGHLPCDLPPGRDDFPDLLRFDDFINMGASLFRTSVIQEHGAFDPSLTIDDEPGRFFRATDWDLVLRLSLRGIQSTFIYAPLSAFRIHGNQASVGDDFNQQGIAPREAAVLLDRYLVPENRSRLAGHESGILALLAGKRAHYLHFAKPGLCGDPKRVENSFSNAENFLHRLRNNACDEEIAQATVTVVLTQMDDAEKLQASLQTLEKQDYPFWEAVVVNRGHLHLGCLSEDKNLPGKIRYIHLPGASLAEARNIGACLGRGSLICFLEAGSELAAEHLTTLAASLGKSGCIAVQSQTETYEPSECSVLHHAWQTLVELVLPTGHPWRDGIPPLSALAMRRPVFMRLEGHDSNLPLLSDLDLILRLERDYPVHQLVEKPTIRARSLVANLFEQNKAMNSPGALEQSLQAVARRFAISRNFPN